uniref:Peptidase S1 domain-containing protein n=1 Tax=Steinernema glaseri TaxID=37863 RepID=A0A1I7XXG4_9BILA
MAASLASGQVAVNDTRHKNAQILPDWLLKTNIRIHDPTFCRTTDNMICGGDAGRGTGPGDSGGPVVVKHGGSWWQVGIHNAGSALLERKMHQDRYPSFFARAKSFCAWIEKKLNMQICISQV